MNLIIRIDSPVFWLDIIRLGYLKKRKNIAHLLYRKSFTGIRLFINPVLPLAPAGSWGLLWCITYRLAGSRQRRQHTGHIRESPSISPTGYTISQTCRIACWACLEETRAHLLHALHCKDLFLLLL
jgi:hypothetical protein